VGGADGWVEKLDGLDVLDMVEMVGSWAWWLSERLAMYIFVQLCSHLY